VHALIIQVAMVANTLMGSTHSDDDGEARYFSGGVCKVRVAIANATRKYERNKRQQLHLCCTTTNDKSNRFCTFRVIH
jgi:hypothetical protein